MEPAVRVEVIGFVALAIVCLVSAYASWQTRRLLITVFGENPRAARLTERGYYVSVAEQAPLASSGARAIPPAPVPAPAVEPAEGAAPAASKRAREFPQPSLAPEARAPEASARLAVRPPPLAREEPEPPAEPAVETTRKPGASPSSRKRPAVTAPADLATLALDLDTSDQAQADPAPERRVPVTRQPSSRQASAASTTHASVAPPASAGPALPSQPGITASGLGSRPDGRRETESMRPAPHPLPTRKRTILGINPPSVPPPVSARPLPTVTPPPARAVQLSQPGETSASVAPIAGASGDTAGSAAIVARPGLFLLSLDGDFDLEEEKTTVLDRPSPEALGLAPGAQGAPRVRASYSTLASMTAVVPPSARPAPDVKVVEADPPGEPDQRATPTPRDRPGLVVVD
ncbi:MAG: hypothetical protein ABJE95_24220 [Byssovorax sp.]